ncbi:MAG: hypothetical protein NTY38_14365, partial [Acidobacteria bacterium]|nr:hypothetical protein [Acidobacteriota bacterium]
MTNRERMLAAIRGEAPDRVPFVPRIEFWHRAHLRKGTLPPHLAGLDRMGLAGRLGVGHYAIVPDFTESPELERADRALGILRHPHLPFTTTMNDVERRVLRSGQETVVEYRTPVGTIRTAALFTDEMLDGGASDPHVSEYAIQKPEDFAVVGHIFSHLQIEPDFDGLRASIERAGERGLVVAYASSQAGPVHHIMAELMRVEDFFYALNDCPEQVERLVEQMEPYYARIEACAATCPAEVVLYGANYDDSITHAAFFRRHILPRLRSFGDRLHANGKYLLTHTDGENRRLLPLYLEAGFDVADSVCPFPMTRCTLDELHRTFAGHITIVGGIPSVLLCPDSVGEADFRSTIDQLVSRYGH